MGMENKLAVIISINDKYNYPIRTIFSTRVLNSLGYKVRVVSSDFDHRTKEKYKDEREGLIQIPTIPYTKNLSFSRIWSLINFSHKACKKVEELKPNLIYVSGPPNTQYKVFSKYKKKHPNVIVCAEVGDMWPESLPISGKLKTLLTLPMRMWAALRDKYIGKLDFVVTECKLFEKMLSAKVQTDKVKTIYFCKDDIAGVVRKPNLNFDTITIAYVGSINNIIDIEIMGQLVSKITQSKHVVFHLIGVGEKKEALCKTVTEAGAELIDHGAVYDAIEKGKILSRCMFAFNVMKSSVCVGMTMKSLDYFQFNVPVLNNIEGDIWDMVLVNNVGFNFNKQSIEEVATKVCTLSEEQWMTMKRNTNSVFEENFSIQAFEKKFLEVYEQLVYGGKK